MFKTIRDMPMGVMPLYFIQAFSTFSFAILYSSLPLYLTNQLDMPSAPSNSIVGLFLAFNYILQLIGGLIGGRFLSNRVLFFITIIIQTIGLIFLALSQIAWVYVGLSLFLVGCGLNTTCYNSMLTQRFKPLDDRRENAFFLSYAAMNIGFFSGYIASGFFDFSNQYQYLFCACMCTNAITLFLVIQFRSHLNDNNTPLIQCKNRNQRRFHYFIGIGLTLWLIPMMLFCFHSAYLSNGVVVSFGILMFLIILTLGFQQKNQSDKYKIMGFLILAISTILFWMIFFTGPIGITLFIKNNVNKNLFGLELATQWVKNFNPLVIVVAGPVISAFFNKLKKKGYNISVSIQFMFAFIFLALSFLSLTCGIIFSNPQGYTHLFWVIGYIVMQGLAELLIGPVGYALIGRIAPPQLQGILMGSWMLVAGVAASLSQYLSNAMIKTQSTNPLLTNPDFIHVFKQLTICALLGSLFIYFISKIINHLLDSEANANEDRANLALLGKG